MNKNNFFIALISCFIFSPLLAFEKTSDVYRVAKNAIVKISSIHFGSGVLLNTEGMILTNNRLVSGADNLNVKFSSGQEVPAKTLSQDFEKDLAIIWVNLSGIKNYSTLTNSKNKPLVLVGEEVLALGSPINYESKETTLTAGIVGKYQGDLIIHDASLNAGNIGGPLLNYDAEIVGINSITKKSKGKAMGTAIAVKDLSSLIQKASIKKSQISKPAKASNLSLRPDYPIEKVKFYNLKKEPRKSDYKIGYEHQYTINAETPLTNYREFLRLEERKHKRREKKARKRDIEISDDEYLSKNLAKHNFEGMRSALVNITAEPNIIRTRLADGSISTNVPSHYVKAIDITDKEGRLLCKPVTRARQDITYSLLEHEISNRVFSLKNKYLPECFSNKQKIYVKITFEDREDIEYERIDEDLKEIIINDFKPYWGFLRDGVTR
ncbi:MAG: trypsin-like peptidase domain-containing protein [Candidatus Caenarcaniphilales bacterium]|nr:trypsin-like peptidase domain-containing protein [Candidatus Caenarcaniphilales bacterium]